MNNTDNKNDADNTIVQNNINVPKKFELAIYDENIDENTGKTTLKYISYNQPIIIEAYSPADLKSKLNMYKQCGQVAKVVREIPNNNSQINEQQIFSNIQKQTNEVNLIKKDNKDNYDISRNINNKDKPELLKKSSIKYYKVGDIEIKNDNGKLYQKQWMMLTEKESQNIRVINDKNNSIINMNGKHFELKKWILIENQNSDESLNIEENLINE